MSAVAIRPPRLLRSADVADLCGVSRRTVTVWAKAGKLPFVGTPGGQYRFPESAVIGFIKARQGIRPNRAATPDRVVSA